MFSRILMITEMKKKMEEEVKEKKEKEKVGGSE